MNKATILFAALAGIAIGLSANTASAAYLQGEPGEAPLVSQDGGKPVPVNPAEVRRDNTAGPGVAPLVPEDGYGKPAPVSPAELRRDDTANPWHLPSATR